MKDYMVSVRLEVESLCESDEGRDGKMEDKQDQEELNNIDIFNLAAAMIFDTLYNEFPIPVAINPQEILERLLSEPEIRKLNTQQDTAQGAGNQPLSQKVIHYNSIVHYTLSWLEKCKFITGSRISKSPNSKNQRKYMLLPKTLRVLASKAGDEGNENTLAMLLKINTGLLNDNKKSPEVSTVFRKRLSNISVLLGRVLAQEGVHEVVTNMPFLPHL